MVSRQERRVEFKRDTQTVRGVECATATKTLADMVRKRMIGKYLWIELRKRERFFFRGHCSSTLSVLGCVCVLIDINANTNIALLSNAAQEHRLTESNMICDGTEMEKWYHSYCKKVTRFLQASRSFH